MTTGVALGVLAVALFFIGAISAAVGAAVVLPPRWWGQAPWPERARMAHAARVGTAINAFALAFVLGWVAVVYVVVVNAAVGRRPPPVAWVLAAHLAGVAGAAGVAMWMAWRTYPRRPRVGHFLAGCASAILFGFPNAMMYAVMGIALLALPRTMPNVIAILVVGAVGTGFAAWGGGIWVARVLGLARPALPRAQNAADWAGERVGVRASAVFELTWPKVTLDAFVFSKYVVVTDAAAELFTDDELLALSIREITFFQQPWLAGGVRAIDSAIIYFMLACTAIGATVGGNAMLVGLLIGMGSNVVMRPLYKRIQLKADALAAQSAIDPGSALRALERQYELNLTPVVAVSSQSRDAHLYDRLVAAGVPPAYPRPAPPAKTPIVLSVLAAGGTCVALSVAFLIFMGVIVRL